MSAKRAKCGGTLSNGPPNGQPWVWMTSAMFGSITFRALGIHARRILDFLMHEHAIHGGRENGNLAAPYKHLEAWGVTAADVRKGLAELRASGLIRLTFQGMRQAGGGEPSRYALTWLPIAFKAPNQQPPTHDWRGVIETLAVSGVGSVAHARRWLDEETQNYRRGMAKKRGPTPHLQVVSPLTCEARRAV